MVLSAKIALAICCSFLFHIHARIDFSNSVKHVIVVSMGIALNL